MGQDQGGSQQIADGSKRQDALSALHPGTNQKQLNANASAVVAGDPNTNKQPRYKSTKFANDKTSNERS